MGARVSCGYSLARGNNIGGNLNPNGGRAGAPLAAEDGEIELADAGPGRQRHHQASVRGDWVAQRLATEAPDANRAQAWPRLLR